MSPRVGRLSTQPLAWDRGDWELCSLRYKNFSTSVTDGEEYEIAASTENQPITHDFVARTGNCTSYLKKFLSQACLQGDCVQQPVLICAREQPNNVTSVSVLDENVCLSRANGFGYSSSLIRSNDTDIFTIYSEKASMQCFVWLIAIIALLGNTAVVCRSSRQLLQRFKLLSAVERVHYLQILNLSLSDLMMGVYLVMFIAAHWQVPLIFSAVDMYKWLSSATCNAMGVLSFCSCQMSVAMLVVITTSRLLSVLRPFADQRKRFKISLIIINFAWLFWIACSLLPVLPIHENRNTFYDYVKIESLSCFKQGDMRFEFLLKSMLDIRKFIKTKCSEETAEKFPIPHEPEWQDLLRFGQKLKILSTKEPAYFGYYNQQSVCTAKYFVTNDSVSEMFTLAVIAHNLVAFSYICIAYIVIWIKTVQGKRLLGHLTCFCCFSQPAGHKRGVAACQRDKENRRMQMQIMIIVATDFLCWVPLCVVSLYHFCQAFDFDKSSGNFKQYVAEWRTAVSVLTFVLLPVNSAINPFVYSFHYWATLKSKLLKQVQKERRPSARRKQSHLQMHLCEQ